MTPLIERSRYFANRVSLKLVYAETITDPAAVAKLSATAIEETMRYIESLDLASIGEQLTVLLDGNQAELKSYCDGSSAEAQTDLMDAFGFQHSFIERMGNEFNQWTPHTEPVASILTAIRTNYLLLSDWAARPGDVAKSRQRRALLAFANGLALMVAATEQSHHAESNHQRKALIVAAAFGGSLVVAEANKMVEP